MPRQASTRTGFALEARGLDHRRPALAVALHQRRQVGRAAASGLQPNLGKTLAQLGSGQCAIDRCIQLPQRGFGCACRCIDRKPAAAFHALEPGFGEGRHLRQQVARVYLRHWPGCGCATAALQPSIWSTKRVDGRADLVAHQRIHQRPAAAEGHMHQVEARHRARSSRRRSAAGCPGPVCRSWPAPGSPSTRPAVRPRVLAGCAAFTDRPNWKLATAATGAKSLPGS